MSRIEDHLRLHRPLSTLNDPKVIDVLTLNPFIRHPKPPVSLCLFKPLQSRDGRWPLRTLRVLDEEQFVGGVEAHHQHRVYAVFVVFGPISGRFCKEDVLGGEFLGGIVEPGGLKELDVEDEGVAITKAFLKQGDCGCYWLGRRRCQNSRAQSG